jgi:hypothetical protein
MGAEEGRAFYWRIPARSNDRFSSLGEHLATRQYGCGCSARAILGEACVG